MELKQIPLGVVFQHVDNAREKREYTKTGVADLAASIRKHGLLQPLVVTPDGDNYRRGAYA